MGKEQRRLRVAAGIATVGRPDILLETVKDLCAQSRPPDRIVVCPGSPADCAGLAEAYPHVEIVYGKRGLPAQRNTIIDQLRDCDVVVFFDDDFVTAPDFIEQTEKLFTERPDVNVATGHVLEDGILTGGLELEHARKVAAMPASGPVAAATPTLAAYGCNMAIRLEPVYRLGVRFDENLPLYAWLEDWEFCGHLKQQAPDGEIVYAPALRGVHMGHRSGRQSGLRLGYSQIVNPVYIARKGTIPKYYLYRLMVRNFIANIYKLLLPNDDVDRIGRLRGNLIGLSDLLSGKAHPKKIETMKAGT